MKFVLEPANGFNLWGEFEDVFGCGPRSKNFEAQTKILLKIGLNCVDAYVFPEAKLREKTKRLGRSDRELLKRLKKEKVALGPELDRPSSTKSWVYAGRTANGGLKIEHKTKKEIDGRAYARGQARSVVVRLKPLGKKNESKLFGQFCGFLYGHLRGTWKAIRVLE